MGGYHESNTGKAQESAETVSSSFSLGHGEWVDIMKVTLGKRGKVLKVYPDGDLRVSVGTMTFTFNPACCHMLRQDVNTGESGANTEELIQNSLYNGVKTGKGRGNTVELIRWRYNSGHSTG